MKIGNNSTINFRGRFYVTTDSHARYSMLPGLLSEIGRKSKDYKNPQFYMDNGDFFGDATEPEIIGDIFEKFHKNNSDIPMIFNMGNVEILGKILDNYRNIESLLKRLKNMGCKLLSLTMIDTLKKNNLSQDYLLPYTVIEDKHDGKKEKILISGLAEFSYKNEKRGIEIKSDAKDMKEVLKNDFLPVYKREKPDKTILMLHTTPSNTNEILDYSKELGIDNIALVIGGHTHEIEDYEKGKVRILYPPAQGKGAYIIENTPEEIVFDKIYPDSKNKFNYSPIAKSSSVINNLDIYNPIKPSKEYKEVFDNPVLADSQKPLLIAPFKLKFRNEYDFAVSEPTELGTFMANAYRDQTGADIGLLLSMDMRESSPPKGHAITKYNISDMLNVDKTLHISEGVTADTLKELLEVSFENQQDGIKNKNFVEYSDNFKVDRYVNAKKGEPKVVQMYIKENGKFRPLLDDCQKQLSDEKFTYTTCGYVAVGPSRDGIDKFSGIPSHQVENITGREAFIKEYKKYADMGVTEFKAAEIGNLIKE